LHGVRERAVRGAGLRGVQRLPGRQVPPVHRWNVPRLRCGPIKHRGGGSLYCTDGVTDCSTDACPYRLSFLGAKSGANRVPDRAPGRVQTGRPEQLEGSG
jgi:hypothetical protein